MNCSFDNLFLLINNNNLNNNAEENYFLSEESFIRKYDQADIDFVTAYFSRGFNKSILKGTMRDLFNLSFNAFDIVLHAWLSELPVEKEMIAYARKIITSKKTENNILDADTRAVIEASSKVQREVHRMMGLLRFTPDDKNVFTAKCEPDHFILPCLIEYFTSRFGEIQWTVIDVKRNLNLCRCAGKKAKIEKSSAYLNADTDNNNASCASGDEWEDLWKHYHKIINNEERENANLQRQFMPQRYWKYLPEK